MLQDEIKSTLHDLSVGYINVHKVQSVLERCLALTQKPSDENLTMEQFVLTYCPKMYQVRLLHALRTLDCITYKPEQFIKLYSPRDFSNVRNIGKGALECFKNIIASRGYNW